MSVHAAILLAVATFVFVMTPGPGIFALISRALTRGALPAVVLALGLISADFIYLSLAVGGLAFVVERFHALFVVVKIIGAAYLIWLGVRTWRAPPRPMDAPTFHRRALWRDYVAGFLTSSSNPKVILFYLGFLPAFVRLTDMTVGRYVLIGAIISLTLFFGCLIYISLCARMRQLFSSTKAVRRLNRASAVILIGAGAAVASA